MVPGWVKLLAAGLDDEGTRVLKWRGLSGEHCHMRTGWSDPAIVRQI